MLGKTHMIGGTCTGFLTTTWLLNHTNFSEQPLIALAAPLLIASASFGSLLPDIDHPNSKMGRRVKPLSKLINKLVGHRGATHTLLAMLIVSLGVFLLNLSLPLTVQPLGLTAVLGITVGYFSHLLLDALTPSGVPLFAPFYKKSIRFAKLTTGKYDTFVAMFMIVGTFLLLSTDTPFVLIKLLSFA